MPAGRDVLYNSDMVTLTALLSQQIGKTVAYTSIKTGFMISFLSASLLLTPPFSPSHPERTRQSACARVFERQLLRCITLAILHR